MSPRAVSPAVFWRRRLLFVAVAIALVWVGLQVVDLAKGDPEPKAAPTTAAPAPTAPAITDGPLPVSLTTGTEACDPQKVRVSPTVRPKQLAGGAVQIGLVVSSTEAKSCTLKPGDADLVAIISANDTPIWDSTLCPTSLLTEPVQVSAGWSTLQVTSWSGKVSGSNCSAKQDFAAAGEYTVEAGTLGGEPGKTTFTLGRRPKPTATTPTPTPTPTKTPTAG